ncbi:MAG: SGNH/GDSL hydrolase family protein [Planctomycetota bacterium]
MSKRKWILFMTIITLASFLVVLVVSEMLLRFKRHHIEGSDHLDYGMIVYDNHLGWKLAPNWNGRHKHYDYDVSYSTNSHGFRNDFNTKQGQAGLGYAFVGDSFTFSFGVNDNETFIQLLNSQEKHGNVYFNFGVPGYSTDQEYLLIRRTVLHFSPDVILLVVYLGNDLFDNELPFPLQANRAKPYYELVSNELVLRNTPVPMEPKPQEQYKKDLTRVVLGEDVKANGLIARIVNRIEMLRLLKHNLLKPPDYSAEFEDRFEHAIHLFTVIVDQIRNACIQKEVKMKLILMPGRSFVEQPYSASAQFQNYLRKRIVENSEDMKVDVIDLAAYLRERYQRNPGKWYYPNEGHLTAEGHRIVLDILSPLLQ